MGEFRKQSEEIIQRLDENRNNKISIMELPKVTADAVRDNVNCYPGIPGDTCFHGAYFYSLNKKNYSKTNNVNLSLYFVLSKMVQHLIGSCEGETKYAVLITDNWDDTVFNHWKSTFEKIKKHAHIEVYLMTSGNYLEIKI